MSEPKDIGISARHYQALCGLALGAIFVLQMQQGVAVFVNVMLLIAGGPGIVYPTRIGPLAVLIALFAGQLLQLYYVFEVSVAPGRFDLATLLLAMAALTYVIGQYRLQGLRFGLLPGDSRQASAAQARSAQSLTPVELAMLVGSIPLSVLFANALCFMLNQHWTVVGLPPRWKQFLTIAWTVLLLLFLSAHAFRYWRRLQMDRATAQMLLQDVLWNETRGEQRRLNRWIVWKRLKETRGDA